MHLSLRINRYFANAIFLDYVNHNVRYESFIIFTRYKSEYELTCEIIRDV